MEKNFAAVIKKKYPRKPYESFSLGYLIKRLREEVKELADAIDTDLENAKGECADVFSRNFRRGEVEWVTFVRIHPTAILP